MSVTINQVRAAIQRAITTAGSQVQLAALISARTGRPIKTGNIFYWIKRGTVPPECCVAIENCTGVLRRELRPDDYWLIWPDLIPPEVRDAA